MNGSTKTKTKRKRKSFDYASNSIGRVAVSKTACWGFESLLACFEGRRMNGVNGMSDIEGKAVRVAASELGNERVSIMKDESHWDLISSLNLHPSTFFI